MPHAGRPTLMAQDSAGQQREIPAAADQPVFVIAGFGERPAVFGQQGFQDAWHGAGVDFRQPFLGRSPAVDVLMGEIMINQALGHFGDPG